MDQQRAIFTRRSDKVRVDITDISLKRAIHLLNQDAQDWMDQEPGRWASMLTDDLEHWAGYGIINPTQLLDYLDACCQREIEKARYGL